MPNDIHAVTFDLYDTILLMRNRRYRHTIEYEIPEFRKIVKEAYPKAKPGRGEIVDAWEKTSYEYIDKCQTSMDQVAGFLRELGIYTNTVFLKTCNLTQGMDYGSYFVLEKDAASLIKKIRASGMKVGLVTNAFAQRYKYIDEALGISAMFDAVCVSETEKVAKPDPRIFTLALERLGARPEESIHIGNEYDLDVTGPRNAGMKSIWLTNKRDKKDADYAVRKLGGVLKVLGL